VPEVFATRAIVLRAVATGESDRVVTLLGRNTGRISAMARGARKSTRRFAGGLGLAASGEACFRERAGAELALLESFDVRQGRHSLGADLGRTAQAGYVAELCNELCAPRQPEVAVYDLLDSFLDALDERGAHVARLRTFELGLLTHLGMAPTLSGCVGCGRADLADEIVRLDLVRGGITCRTCARGGTPIHPSVRRALERLASASLTEAETITLARDDANATRAAVGELVAQHLTRPLKSLEFLRKMQSG
jgi:DNA repair protein RecO (recombination protein O)